ncbi:hypothetical protein SeMB42_g01763 [Synchytrium endobioticum]|uniref:ABC1 atypical kinase-like domain-containing protein n=1 Tax=Synchytrium endobioticum TaxID=286115 RepID=A0A507D9L1_9FUNG|nr:hypothetical protein SeLEV6574_g02196 [Synchytrium endobioticum]TPX51935.1 hypothetical protein SeMB42_g01763 [Synchytrium endobioticum]
MCSTCSTISKYRYYHSAFTIRSSAPSFRQHSYSAYSSSTLAAISLIAANNTLKPPHSEAPEITPSRRKRRVSPFVIVGRLAYLACLFLPVMVSFPVWWYFGKSSIWWVRLVCWSFEHAGAAFIKLGQWAATRSDLFDTDIRLIFARLQSQVTPHSLKATRTIIFSQLGASIDDIFEEFDEHVIGTGAIAQVYKAKIRNHPGYVAVKVLHPGVEDQVWLSLTDEAQTFADMMVDQLDLSQEGRHLVQFRKEFSGWRYVAFPKPLQIVVSTEGHVLVSDEINNNSGHRVLVEEFVDGTPLSRFMRCSPSLYDEEIARLGLETFLEMLLINNHVHVDMHPGNIMVTFVPKNVVENTLEKLQAAAISLPRQSSRSAYEGRSPHCAEFRAVLSEMYDHNYRPKLVILDTGLSTTLSPTRRRDLIDLLRAIAEFRGNDAGRLMIQRSRDPSTVVDEEGFAAKIDKIILGVKRNTLALGRVGIGQILSDVLTAVRVHRVRLEGDFANIVVAIIVTEGIGRQLDDELDLLAATVPVLSRLDSQSEAKGEFRHIVAEGVALHIARFFWSWTDRITIEEYERARQMFPEY